MSHRKGGGLRRVFVVFKTHLDVGFTGLVAEVLDAYAGKMVPQALDACRISIERDPTHPFVWTLPAWLLARSLEALKGTARGIELEQRVGEGRVCWHALPLTTHTEAFGVEDFIRGLYVARSLGHRFGRTAIAAKMTDVPGHTWILPSILHAAGIRFLHLGCNRCSTPPDVPLMFDWEGPDGTRVTTMYSRGGYGTPLLPPQDWDLPIWLALQHTSDNAGPQRAEAVQSALEEIHARFPKAEMTIGSLDDFARALEEVKPCLPVVRKDLADTWIHGLGTMPAEVARSRALRNDVVRLESAAALRRVLDPAAAEADPEQAQVFEKTYEKLLLFGEHTWGMDTKLALNPPEFGGRVYEKAAFREVLRSGRYARIVQSWDDKRKLLLDAEDLLAEAEKLLAAAAEIGWKAAGKRAISPGFLRVVNHHMWKWNGMLRIGRCERALKVTRIDNGQELRSTVIDGEAFLHARDLPALSVTGVRVEESHAEPGKKAWNAAAKSASFLIRNERIAIRVSRDAGITSIVDRETAREWVDRRSGVPFGAYRYDVYSRREIVEYLKSYAYELEAWYLDDFGRPVYPELPHRTFTGTLAGVRQDRGQGWQRVRLTWRQPPESAAEFGNAPSVDQVVTLFDDEPWADIHYTMAGKQESPLLEAGHVVFLLSSSQPRIAINKTGSVIDPARDIAKDANHGLHCCDRWVDISDERGGLLVIPFDTPLFSLGAPAIEHFVGSGNPEKAALWFNLFNTQWGTNFPQWIGGDLSFRYRLVPHSGDWRAAKAWEHAASALQPPRCAPVEEAAGIGTARLLARPSSGLETVTLKQAEARDGLILRVREPSGRGGRRTLRLSLPVSEPGARFELFLCSLLEEEGARVRLEHAAGSARAELIVRPFEIVTLKLKTTRKA